NPLPTGSPTCVITMGIVTVASLAARAAGGPAETMTSTLRRTSSAASAGRRSSFPSAYRHSMTMFFPSTSPSSRRPSRNASNRTELFAWDTAARKPILGIFGGCCASAIETVVSRKVASSQLRIFSCIGSNSDCCLLPRACCLTNHLTRPRQHVRRNREADLLRRFEIYHQLELGRLLYGQIRGLGSFQDLFHVCGGSPVQVGQARSVGHQTAGLHKQAKRVHRRQPVLCCKANDLRS